MEQQSRLEIMQKIAGWLSAGVVKGTRRDKEILRLCNNYRVWARDGEQRVEVGRHGTGKPVVVIEKRQKQANDGHNSP